MVTIIYMWLQLGNDYGHALKKNKKNVTVDVKQE